MNGRNLAFAPLLLLAVACDSSPTPKKDVASASATAAGSTVAQAAPPGSMSMLPPERPKPKPAAKAAIPAPPDVAKAPDDAEKTASGLQSKVLKKGTGDTHPGPTDKVEVHYTGWSTDGKMFDSSVQRGRPASFPLNGVIKGWTEGLQLMVAGEKRRFWIPADLAYGETPRRPGAPAGDLTFDVELLKIFEAPKPPENLTAPADAKKTKSGLAYKKLEAGKGTTHPKESDRVTVDYSGWTTDGKMFDSSVTRGRPATFPLGGVIKGWTEGVQLMVEGDKFRFWIPADLAYGDTPKRPGAPAGDLVFDVQLVKISGGAPPRRR